MPTDRLAHLAEFPFRRLAALLAGVEPGAGGASAADLSIGEPKHAPPPLLAEVVAANARLWNRYPPVGGTPEFRAAVAGWLERRFGLPGGAVDPERCVLPLAGTKEGLFLLPTALARVGAAVGGNGRPPAVLMPNPVYAVYYGAALMAGAEPVLLPAARESGFLPDLDALSGELLARTALFYLCSPANPQGAVADAAYLARTVALAREHGFVLAVDECYSEIYDREGEPPPGALAAALRGSGDFRNVLVFNSLSKRSSAAGLRSGFVAGDPAVLAWFVRLRAYAAAVQPLPLLAAAAALWRDEDHVAAGRARYRAKVDAAEAALEGRLGFYRPAGGFFLWLNVGDGEAASLRLWREAGIKTLPGAYLGVASGDTPNPGGPYLRVALLDEPEQLRASLGHLAATLTAG
jgi:aspartate/methionine/tyrosine aminotransferase